jgi:hypothetical protein
MSVERIVVWVCESEGCDYWRGEKTSGVHAATNPADPNGKLLTHELRAIVFVRERKPRPDYDPRVDHPERFMRDGVWQVDV